LPDTCLFFCLNGIKTNMVEILQHARAVTVVFSPFFNMKHIVGTGNYPYLCMPFKKQVGCAVRKVRRPGSSGAGGAHLYDKISIKLWISVLQCAICALKRSGSRGWAC